MFNHANPYLLAAISSVLLTACLSDSLAGSHETNSDKASTASAAVDTTTDIILTADNTNTDNSHVTSLTVEQAGSLALKVPKSFNFSDTQTISINISAMASDGYPIAYKKLSIYKVPDTISQWNDEQLQQAELIMNAKTNDQGVWQHQLEIANNVSQVLIVLSYIGIENKVLVPIHQQQVNYQFQ